MVLFTKNRQGYKPKKPGSRKIKRKARIADSEYSVKESLSMDLQPEKNKYYENGLNMMPASQSDIDALKSKAVIFIEEVKSVLSASIGNLESRCREEVDMLLGYLKGDNENIDGLDYTQKRQKVYTLCHSELGFFNSEIWLINIRLILILLFLTIGVSADFSLMLNFFAEFNRNNIGVVSLDLYLILALKSIPPVAAVFLMKGFLIDLYELAEQGLVMNIALKIFKTVLFFLVLYVGIHLGWSLTGISGNEFERYLDMQQNEQIVSIFPNQNIAQSSSAPRKTTGESNISNSEVREHFSQGYMFSFVLLTMFSAFLFVDLIRHVKVRKRLLGIKKSLIIPLKRLEDIDVKLQIYKSRLEYIRGNELQFVRYAQDSAHSKFMEGLAVIGNNATLFKLFTAERTIFKKFPIFTVFPLRFIRFIDVKEAEIAINKCMDSWEVIVKVNPEMRGNYNNYSKTTINNKYPESIRGN